MNQGNVAFRRDLERDIKLRLVDKLEAAKAIVDYDPHSENSKVADKNPVTNPRKRKTGLSIGLSVAETCTPTDQCVGCYASEPETHSTYDNKIVKDLANIWRIRRNAVKFAAQSVKALRRRASYRTKIDFGVFYSLRWLSSGDLTPAVVRAIVAWLQLTSDWTDSYGKPIVATVFSRKSREVNMLIAQAESAGVAHRLSINVSLDGTRVKADGSPSNAVAETYERLRELGVNRAKVRLVQYARAGDVIFDNAAVYFPHHDKRTHDSSFLPTSARDRICPAIGNAHVGCLNCSVCFWPTVSPFSIDKRS